MKNDTNSGTTTGSASATADKSSGVRSRASSAYSSTRERTSAAFDSVRERASEAVSTGRQQIETNPALAIAGGVAIGAVLGALLPRTQREKELLGGVGSKVNDAAREAANTAVEAGRQQVSEIKNNAMQKVGEAVVGAVTSSSEPANAQ